MPLPHWIARLNKRFTNRFIEPIVRHSRHYAIIDHTGRTTSARYRTPVFAFWDEDTGYVALTYGPRADWVRNVRAGGGRCSARSRPGGRMLDVGVVDRKEAWHVLPWPTRVFLSALRVRRFLRFRLEP